MTTNTEKAQIAPNPRIVRPITAPTIYVDGVSQLMVGYPNSRLMLASLLHRAQDNGTPDDVHHVGCELVMPTTALIEMAQSILNNLAQSKPELLGASAEWMQKVQAVIEQLPQQQPEAD